MPMPTTTPSRAASAAAVHFGSINSSRKRAGLAPLILVDVEAAFADADRPPVRAKGCTLPTGTNQASADSMWGGIVSRLNSSLLSSRTPIGARRASPAPASSQPNRAVDWSSIAADLNREAGLPGRRAS
jgi:hypothetical protein